MPAIFVLTHGSVVLLSFPMTQPTAPQQPLTSSDTKTLQVRRTFSIRLS